MIIVLFSLKNPEGKLILTRSRLYRKLLKRANSHFALTLMLYLFVHSKTFPKKCKKSADLKNLYYPSWVRAGGPSAREGRARARARAKYKRKSRFLDFLLG